MNRDEAFARYHAAHALFKDGRSSDALQILEDVHAAYPNLETVREAMILCRRTQDLDTPASEAALVEFPPPHRSSNIRWRKPVALAVAAIIVGVIAGRLVPAIFSTIAHSFNQHETPTGLFHDVPALPDASESKALSESDLRRLTAKEPATAASNSQKANGDWSFTCLEQQDGIRYWQSSHGAFLDFVPQKAAADPWLIFVVHDAPTAEETARESALAIVRATAWKEYAESSGAIIIAPVYEEERYGHYGSLGGRTLAADLFLSALAHAYRQAYALADQRVAIYGDGEGGAFALRFAVTHPYAVLATVAFNPTDYSMPEAGMPWISDKRDDAHAASFQLAAGLPVTIIAPDDVGAQAWVSAMADLANAQGLEPRAEWVATPSQSAATDHHSLAIKALSGHLPTR
jgi:hypothetical protein